MERVDALILKFLSLFRGNILKKLNDGQIQLLSQMIKFGCVGVINTIVSYTVTVFCVFLGVPLLISNAIAFIISTANAFILNYLFVFLPRPVWYKGLIKSYCSYAFTGIGLNSVLLYLLSTVLGVSEYISPLIVLIVTIPTNFLLNKLWAFKK